MYMLSIHAPEKTMAAVICLLLSAKNSSLLLCSSDRMNMMESSLFRFASKRFSKDSLSKTVDIPNLSESDFTASIYCLAPVFCLFNTQYAKSDEYTPRFRDWEKLVL